MESPITAFAVSVPRAGSALGLTFPAGTPTGSSRIKLIAETAGSRRPSAITRTNTAASTVREGFTVRAHQGGARPIQPFQGTRISDGLGHGLACTSPFSYGVHADHRPSLASPPGDGGRSGGMDPEEGPGPGVGSAQWPGRGVRESLNRRKTPAASGLPYRIITPPSTLHLADLRGISESCSPGAQAPPDSDPWAPYGPSGVP